MDIFTDVFDSTTKDGVRVLTVEGEEQIARAWEYYLDTGGAPTGSVMMLFVKPSSLQSRVGSHRSGHLHRRRAEMPSHAKAANTADDGRFLAVAIGNRPQTNRHLDFVHHPEVGQSAENVRRHRVSSVKEEMNS